ncbi:MAG: hypothetical protein ACO1OX_07290 [Novosphingobium sp.]
MKRIVVVAVAAVVVVALLMAIWVKGGAQPMQWVEQPVDDTLEVSAAQ